MDELDVVDNPADDSAASPFENETKGRKPAEEAGETSPSSPKSPRSPLAFDAGTVETIRGTVNMPGKAAAAVGGKGWAVMRAGVDIAKTARPQVSEEELLAHVAKEDQHRPLWVIDPMSYFWQVWCLGQGVIVCLLMFKVPFDLAFVCMDMVTKCRDLVSADVLIRATDDLGAADGSMGNNQPADCDAWEGPSILELTVRNLADLLILIDFGLHFVLGFSKYDLKRRKPVWIWKEKLIVKHYLASPGFVYDLVGCFPLDTMFRMQGTRDGYITADIMSVFRIARLPVVFKITKPVHEFVARLAVFFPPIEPISQLFYLIVWIAGITHLMACALYFVGHPLWDDSAECREHGICGWVTSQGWDEVYSTDPANTGNTQLEDFMTTKYVTALYYASTQITTVGFGDISAATTFERAFSVISQMFGGFVFGYVLGNISTVLANENLAASTHVSYMETLHHFMKAEGVPPPLHKKVMSYMESRYPRHILFDEGRIWEELPPTLRGEIAVHRHGHVVEHGDLFHELEYATLSLLCQRIDVMSFMKGDTVTSAGARAETVFIVKAGQVHIFERFDEPQRRATRSEMLKEVDHEENESLIEVAASGQPFSELAAIMPYTQQFTCRCAAYCVICTLRREHIWELAQIRHDLADSLARFTRRSQGKIEELCSKKNDSTTYKDVLDAIEGLKSGGVPSNIDAILGGGISGGVSASCFISLTRMLPQQPHIS